MKPYLALSHVASNTATATPAIALSSPMKNRNKQTKFPVVSSQFKDTNLFAVIFTQARIKKIMQKDEEVGKVAQATPVVICTCIHAHIALSLTVDVFTAKSLELFLAMIIQEANKVTAERGSHKVEAYHL